MVAIPSPQRPGVEATALYGRLAAQCGERGWVCILGDDVLTTTTFVDSPSDEGFALLEELRRCGWVSVVARVGRSNVWRVELDRERAEGIALVRPSRGMHGERS